MLAELNKRKGEEMNKKEIVNLALKYGDTKYQLALVTAMKEYNPTEYYEKEYHDLSKKREEILMQLLDASLEN